MISYVVKKWEVSEKINEEGNYVEIKGRAGSCISWIFSKLGISPTVTMKLCEDALSFETGSWSGKIKKIIPYKKMVSLVYGYYKPWKEAIIAFALAYFILRLLCFTHYFCIIVAVILALIYYILNKVLEIGVYDESGKQNVIYFRRSVIEGHKIHEKDAEKVCEILYSRIKENI